MPQSLKKFVLLFGVGLLLAFGLSRAWGPAAGLGLALALWLLLETRRRTRFRFIAEGVGGVWERDSLLAAEVLDLRCGGSAVYIHGQGTATVQAFDGSKGRHRALPGAPLDLLALPDGSLICAEETRLTLSDPRGRLVRSLEFEPPLLRQGYRLLSGPDSDRAVLLTPWFAQVFDRSLERLRGRVRFEDAGHYFKYAALGAQGRGLLLGGAYLLDEDDGGALEARWDWWESAEDGSWARRWRQARESYENSQLRGVQARGGVLCTELWRSGYAFELRGMEGDLLWDCRGGERPALSPAGHWVLWEQGSSALVLSDRSGRERWRWVPKEQIRLKRVLDDGSCVVLEGRCIRRFSPDGAQAPELWLKEDAAHAAWAGDGMLVLAAGRHAALARFKRA